MTSAVVVLAAGSGRRVGAGVNKALLPVAGRPLLVWSVIDAVEVSERAVVVVAAPDEVDHVAAALGEHVGGDRFEVVAGGADRHGSEWAALQHLRLEIESGAVEVVVVHDGARPLAGTHLFRSIMAAARRDGGAVPVVDKPALVSPDADPGRLEQIAAVQTPQAFGAVALLAAYTRAADAGFAGTDTASSIVRFAGPEVTVTAVPGSARNLKVTYPEDVAAVERLLA